MTRLRSVVLGILVLAGTGSAQESSVGFDAEQVDVEIQKRVETALRSKYALWGLEKGEGWSRSSVRLLGSWKTESLRVWTQYMVTTEDAERRLNSYQYTIPVGIGDPICGIGEEAFLMIYGSQVILRLRQHEVVAEIRTSPTKREGPWNDGLTLQRKKLVLEAADLVVEQIRGF